MNEPLKLLLVEDSEDDALLLLRDLRTAGFDVACTRVQTADEMRAALAGDTWDAIISDFILPSFNGSAALAIAKASHQDIPFLIVSGTLGEELAVEVMRAGAHDYLMKDNLRRLPEALRRELREARGRLERRQLEEQLRRRQKLEVIGALAGGIAHDFNNILTGIFGYLHLLRPHVTDRPEALEDVDEIESAARRAKDLVSQILSFSRRESSAMSAVNVSNLIREVTRLLRASLAPGVRLEVELPSDLPAVLGSATGLHQVIMNLTTNAAQALVNGRGCIRITVRRQLVTHPEAEGLAHFAPGPAVVVEVADDGIGMDATMVGRIFDPFFTTKSRSGGTGLGLATVLGIVRNHHGAIRVTSAPRQGTVFSVFLPALAAECPEPVAVSVHARGAGQTVLLVDDEAAIAHAMARALTELGYRLLLYHSGTQALQELGRHPDNFQLLLCDLMMPEMNGTELIREARRICPGLPVVLTSGAVDHLESEEVRSLGINGILPKPYAMSELAGVVASALASVPPR